MRQVNRSLVLDALRAGAPLSRADLARFTGLTKPTISSIVRDLLREGTVEEIGVGGPAAVGGRPPRLLHLNDAAVAWVGCHFGVQRTTVAVADGRSRIRSIRWHPSVIGEPQHSLHLACGLMDRALQDAGVPSSRVQAVGVAVAGPVERATGICLVAPNLRWSQFPVGPELEAALGCPVAVLNTIHAGALAEARVGAATGANSFVWLYAGSGIGAGIVIDGQIFYGHAGLSGEIGHCGVVDSGQPTLLAQMKGELDAPAVASAASEGDMVALRILAEAGDYLGRGASYLINILNPEMVVLGGSLAQAGDSLLGPLRSSLRRHTFGPTDVPVVPSRLGAWAELAGAVQVAMERSARSYRIVALGAEGAGAR